MTAFDYYIQRKRERGGGWLREKELNDKTRMFKHFN